MQELVTPLIGIIVTAFLSLWKLEKVKRGTLDLFGKLPRRAQWIPPLLLAMTVTAGEAYVNDGVTDIGELITRAAANGGEAGFLAIGFWHFIKRWRAERVAPVAALLLICSVSLGTYGCSLEAARQARVNSQLRSGTYSAPVQARPAQECKALDDVHIYTAYGAEISLGVGTAAGVLAAADTSTKIENAAIGTGIGAAVMAAGLGYWSQKSGAIWTEQCSQ